VVPAGYLVRFSSNTYWTSAFGAIAYQVVWMVLLQLFRPRLSLRITALLVFIFSCTIEVLQLWHPPFLQVIRTTLPGRLILGTTFRYDDFPPYFAGALLGWGWCAGIRAIRAFFKTL
jgi:Protein of unknown function (DUF2809)